MFWKYLCIGNMFTIFSYLLIGNGYTDISIVSGVLALFFIVLSFFHIAGD